MAGTPYEWGGNDASGIDCSGLVWAAAQKLGIKIPRTSIEQYKKGKPVDSKDAQSGDLIFWDTGVKKSYTQDRKVPGGYVTHVSIYDGEGGMWHASRKGVVHTKVADYLRRYPMLGVRRFERPARPKGQK